MGDEMMIDKFFVDKGDRLFFGDYIDKITGNANHFLN